MSPVVRHLAGLLAVLLCATIASAQLAGSGRLCKGWLNYHRPAVFAPRGVVLGERYESGLRLAFVGDADSSTRPVFIQAGGGRPFDRRLATRRALAVGRLITTLGVRQSRIRIVLSDGGLTPFGAENLPPENRTVAPEGLRVYTDLSRPC